jgi:DUF4097 and DUF4098 domain-containing protein YvlB
VTKTRALVLILGIVLAVFLVGAALVPLLSRDSTSTERLAGTVTEVRVDSERGAVTVRAGEGDGARVTQRRKWILVGPEVRTDLADGVLTVDVSCPALSIASCSADVDVAVPASARADLKTVRGLLSVEGLRGPVRAISEDGDVRVDAPAREVTAASVTGRVDVRVPVVPESVTGQSETGDVTLTVPGGAYRLTVVSRVGGAAVDGVVDDRGASRSLTARTGSGDVRVTGEVPAGG